MSFGVSDDIPLLLFQLSQLLLVDGLSGKEGKDHILGGTRENPGCTDFQLGLLNRLFGDQRVTMKPGSCLSKRRGESVF